MVRSKEGWAVIKGHVGTQILRTDNRASSDRQIPLNHPLIAWGTVVRIVPSETRCEKLDLDPISG